MRTIVVTGYDPAWPSIFEGLRARAWAVVGDFALVIEHVGSTAVPGLAAKPVIDRYIEGKSALLLEILRSSGFASVRLTDIEAANRKQT